MKSICIYTDGACSGNQNDTNIGGWGAILEYKGYRKELYGGERNTTNNRMEMTALLSAFNALTVDGLSIAVFSDSSYLTNCFREKWYENWIRNNWLTAKKTPVENRDLWEALFKHLSRHTVSFYRVKGHVNLKNAKTDLPSLYHTFVEWNGCSFSMEDFLYITEQNIRADALANTAINELRCDEADRSLL